MLATVLSVVTVVALFAAVSAVGALRTPGNENFKAKWADWLRAHDASFVVNPLERWYYSQQAPAAGGRPRALNAVPGPEAIPVPTVPAPVVPAAPVQAAPVQAAPAHLPAPAAIPLIVSPALAGEGQWKASGPIVNGSPAMYVAQYRADTTYTSQITTAVWIDPTVLRVRLVPGAQEPGGTWTEPPNLTGPAPARRSPRSTGAFDSETPTAGSFSTAAPPSPFVPAPPRWSSMTPGRSTSADGVRR